MLYICVTKLFEKKNIFTFSLTALALDIPQALPAKFADSVDLKGGLLNYRVCTVGFLVVESYFSCNTTHTAVHCVRMHYAIRQDCTWRFGDLDFMKWYFTAQVRLIRSPALFSTLGLAVQGSENRIK